MIGLDAGTPTRSGWEDDFPAWCARHGLPTPVMGAPLHGYIVDALFVRERVIVELDSWDFHKGKIAFETDRERDVVMLAHGFVTVAIASGATGSMFSAGQIDNAVSGLTPGAVYFLGTSGGVTTTPPTASEPPLSSTPRRNSGPSWTAATLRT